MQQLQKHSWHGNVRELKNTLERTVALSPDDLIDEVHGLVGKSLETEKGAELSSSYRSALAEVEKQHILGVLENVEGKREKAAAILGITSRTLYRKLKEYNEPS